MVLLWENGEKQGTRNRRNPEIIIDTELEKTSQSQKIGVTLLILVEQKDKQRIPKSIKMVQSTSRKPKARGSTLHNSNGGQNDEYIQEKYCMMYFGDINISTRLDSGSCSVRLTCMLLISVLRNLFQKDNIAPSFLFCALHIKTHFNESDTVIDCAL